MSDQSATSMRVVLTPDIRRVLFGVLLNALGNGLTFTLLLVYLNDIRGIGPDQSSFLLSWGAIVGLMLTAPVGTLIDRIGPRPVMLCGLVIEAFAVVSWSQVHTLTQGFIVTTAMAIGGSAIWPAQNAVLARLAPQEHRQRVFGLNFMLLNAGLGSGGLIAALLVRAGDEFSYQRLYYVNAVSYLAYFLIMLSMRHVRGPEVHHEEMQGSYREVLRDHRVIRLALAGLLMVISGYASIEAGEAIFATTVVGLPPNSLGIIFGVNTFCIFTMQAFILKRIHGKSRTRLMGLVGILWACSWIVVAFAVPTTGSLALFLLSLSQFVFAVGEMLWSPVAPSLANDLAPPHLRGRYNAVVSLQWNVGNSIGPMLVAALLGRGYVYEWLGVLIVGCLVAGYLLMQLRSSLTPAQDGLVDAVA